MIAPIIITALLLLYIGFFVWAWSTLPFQFWIKMIGLVIPLALMAVSIYVLVERIKEIQRGEEDDLSQY